MSTIETDIDVADETEVVEQSPDRGQLSSLLLQRDGVLTKDLLLTPGKFGLGKVPAKTRPDSTTNMVCGFCSTGCGLNVHLARGEAINLTPVTDYPVNLGMACPKGWGPCRRSAIDLRRSSNSMAMTRWPSLAPARLPPRKWPSSVASLSSA